MLGYLADVKFFVCRNVVMFTVVRIGCQCPSRSICVMSTVYTTFFSSLQLLCNSRNVLRILQTHNFCAPDRKRDCMVTWSYWSCLVAAWMHRASAVEELPIQSRRQAHKYQRNSETNTAVETATFHAFQAYAADKNAAIC